MSMSETATKTLDDPSSKLDRAAAVAIRNIRATIHTTSIDIPLLDGKVAGYGREEQKEFVFCEVENDQGVSGFGLTGHLLARSVVDALERHILSLCKDVDPRGVEAIHNRFWWELTHCAMTGVLRSALFCRMGSGSVG